MQSAAKSKELTDSNISISDAKQRTDIDNAITVAIRHSNYSIYVGSLSDANEKWLKTLGYKVSRYSDMREQTITISWN